MIKKDRILLLILLTGFAAVWMACNRERDPCLQPKTIIMRLGFYRHADTGSAIIDTALPNLITAGIDTGTPDYYIVGQKKANKTLMILSSVTDSCRWFVQPDSAVSLRDTLSFYYTRKLQFLSNACGYIYYFNLKGIKTTKHIIDSVKINNADVNNNANSEEHVKIYY